MCGMGSQDGHTGAAMNPPTSQARRFFDAIAPRYDRAYALSGPVSRARIERVITLIGRSESPHVLVLGVGTGRELPMLLDAGYVLTGLDISPNMLALCQKRSRTIPCVLADFWDPLPFDDASFDAVIALHGTIAHPRDDHALPSLGRELARILKPQGVFVAEVPSEAVLRTSSIVEHGDGSTFAVTGPSTFVHHDATVTVSLEGIALDPEGWRRALSKEQPDLHVHVEPLGDVEYRIVAARHPRVR